MFSNFCYGLLLVSLRNIVSFFYTTYTRVSKCVEPGPVKKPPLSQQRQIIRAFFD